MYACKTDYLEFVDNVADLKRRPELEAEVLHEHGGGKEEQRLAVDLVGPEGLHVVGEGGVQQGDLGNGGGSGKRLDCLRFFYYYFIVCSFVCFISQVFSSPGDFPGVVTKFL